MFSWFSTVEARRFANEAAAFLLGELAGSLGQREGKFAGKVEKALLQVDRRVAAFKAQHKLNVYQRAKLANTFLWALRDGGCSPDYAQQLTEWLSVRL